MNWNLGLKIWSTNRHYFDEVRRLCEDGWCDYVELYAVPDSLNEFGTLWKQLNIPFVVHAPHSKGGLNFAVAEKEETNRQLAEQAFAFADLLNAENVIFHPGSGGKDSETIRQLNTLPDNWKQPILLENKPYQAVDDAALICNGYSPETMRTILNETGVGFCFDIGHGICSANSRNTEPFQDIENFEKLNPAMYHLSDNDFSSPVDGHKHLGYGNIDFTEVFSRIDASKRISLETDKWYPDSLRDFEDDVRFLKKGLYEFSIGLAASDDMLDVYELANAPDVRANSLSTEPIPWETHQQWYRKKIADPNCRFYLIRNKGKELCAYVRYEFNTVENDQYVSIAVAASARGRGLGTWALKRTGYETEKPAKALIKTANTASVKMFENAGYVRTGTTQIKDINFYISQSS